LLPIGVHSQQTNLQPLPLELHSLRQTPVSQRLGLRNPEKPRQRLPMEGDSQQQDLDWQQTGLRDAKLVAERLKLEGEAMRPNLTVPQVLQALDAQIAHHREREAFHAGQEALHREERARHAAELERLTKNAEAFRESLDVVQSLTAADPGERLNLTRLVGLAVEALKPDQPFSASELAAEIDRRFGKNLKKPTSRKLVGIVLSRMLDRGRLRLVRKGRPHTEALYARVTE
jgi:hypothetical protein